MSPTERANAFSILSILPPELLTDVLENLDPRSLQTCRQVCQDLKVLIDETAILQYATELYASGTENCVLHKRNVANRVEKLRAFQKHWDDLSFHEHYEITMKNGGVWELYGSVLSQKSSNAEFHFHRLPSSIRGIPKKEWKLSRRCFDVRDYTIDPSQDLLVLIQAPVWSHSQQETTHTLHLMSLESAPGEPHPLAHDDKTLQHVIDFRDLGLSYIISISGEYVALLISTRHSGENEFIIWNWRTGEKKLVLVDDRIRTFSFLSDQYVLLGTLLLPEDEGDTDEEEEADGTKPNLVAVDFQKEGNSPRRITDLETGVSFRYAPLQASTFLNVMEVRSDPAPGWSPRFDVDVPFHLARNHRMYVVSLWVQAPSGVRCLMLFIPWNTFMKRLQTRQNSEEKTSIYQWDEWGPDGSRLVISPHPHSNVWVCYVYGMRYVSLEADISSTNESLVCRVYDFNPVGLRRALQDIGDESRVIREVGVGERIKTSAETTYQLAPTVISEDGLFEGEVRTGANVPYRWRSLPLQGSRGNSRCAAMCTEDNLIVVDNTNDTYHIYSF
ncbi:hypothetical protein BKA70DRAFT_1250852 [Coprinopsis sp. MPI-PUGE-AT-0042]|nr:hypothetical protein BKA70DRAFT_1250852 [Coprinopsis sp. MPI-PUGE-AT-0042]